jgi:hypothetical protein
MTIEAGAEYNVPRLIESCGKNKCAPALDRAETGFDYASGRPVSCGKQKCAKTCNKQTCDYWGDEEDYSCKSLEEEYGCDCFGCKCKVDHIPCDNKLAKKKCNGKTCDEWSLVSGISCAVMEKSFKCSCVGCDCKPPPVCDVSAMKKCADAYKKPCSKGAKGLSKIKCGPCIAGYKANGKGDCDKAVVSKDSCGHAKKGSWGKKAYAGEGYCDDDNNTAGCGWDGGDCCGKDKKEQYSYCKACKCLDCKALAKGDTCIKEFKKTCGSAKYVGDGNCDDNNNNGGCAWDGGDCCGLTVSKKYCKECKCLDCTAKAPPGDACVKSAKKGGGLVKYKKDGNCDDENNNAGCNWDGGDCCGDNVKKTYCKVCMCLDCTKAKKCPKKGKTCGLGPYKGDGNCDDVNNICGCDWDGGDCCGPAVKTKYCKVCKCLDPDYKAPACGAPAYKGDGNCDDENNNKGCAYDGGDCCGVVKKTYCKICKCLDPGYKPSCGSPAYKGDKNCDDENNNKACDYDGGDCCGPAVKKTYCKVCKCLDPKPKIGCGVPAYKGDGNCDDENNIKECDFDGGDCCLAKVVKTYCKICKCKDPKAGCKGSCKSKDYVGDGNCDDENNNCGCKYDGGDCCAGSVKGGKVTTTYCKDCSCVDPKQKKKCNGKCGAKAYVGDGNCDDNNNNCGCNYDGGDCCPKGSKPVSKKYCTVCKCINPK